MKSLTYRYYRKTINFLLKSPKTSFLAVRAHFSTFQKSKKTTPNFFDGKSKTGLGFKIGQQQQKYQHRPTLQPVANPAVKVYFNPLALMVSLNSFIKWLSIMLLQLGFQTVSPSSMNLRYKGRHILERGRVTSSCSNRAT